MLAMGEALLRFDKEANDWLAKRYKVGKAYVAICRDYQLKSAYGPETPRESPAKSRKTAWRSANAGRRSGERRRDGIRTGWAGQRQYHCERLSRKTAAYFLRCRSRRKTSTRLRGGRKSQVFGRWKPASFIGWALRQFFFNWFAVHDCFHLDSSKPW